MTDFVTDFVTAKLFAMLVAWNTQHQPSPLTCSSQKQYLRGKCLQNGSGPKSAGIVGLETDGNSRKAALPSLSLGQSLQSLNYWLLWFSLVIGMGAGFTYLSNLSELLALRPLLYIWRLLPKTL